MICKHKKRQTILIMASRQVFRISCNNWLFLFATIQIASMHEYVYQLKLFFKPSFWNIILAIIDEEKICNDTWNSNKDWKKLVLGLNSEKHEKFRHFMIMTNRTKGRKNLCMINCKNFNEYSLCVLTPITILQEGWELQKSSLIYVSIKRPIVCIQRICS
jgi:hypothetical protein